MAQETPPSKPLTVHVTWSIFHEGCRVYAVPTGAPLLEDRIRPLKDLRDCFLTTQQHNRDATKLIKEAPDTELEQAILQAIKLIPALYSLRDNFAWVAEHEGQLPAFRRLDAVQLYEGIRAIYATMQFHNPNARNLLAAARNLDIHKLVLSLIESNPRSEVNANVVTNRPDDRLIVLDPRKLSRRTLASLQEQIFSLFEGTEWSRVRVDRPTSFGNLVESYYAGQADTSGTTRVLPKIVERNQTSAFKSLEVGQEVSLPPTPTVPQGPADPSVIQAIDLVRRKVSPRDVKSGNALPFSVSILDRSSSWVLAGPASSLATVFSNLPDQARREINSVSYEGPTFQTANLVLTSASCAPSSVERVVTSERILGLRKDADILTTRLRYYVLDFFDPKTTPPGACPHGQKVLEVIRANLQSRGLESLFQSNVIPIELDFFRHSGTLAHYVEDYIRSKGGPNQTFLYGILETLRKRDLNTVGAYETPILYLQAVYDAILNDPSASVVSSSFYTESDNFTLLPDSFKQTGRVLVLSAVDDNPGDSDTFVFEPIRGLYQRRHDFPVLLIGGLLKGGGTFGMTSAKGDGVSCLGVGSGWGDASTCVRPQDQGTSFAAPSVATTVFLARASWLKDGKDISAKDARDRVLHAVELLPNAPAGYLSPGVPNLDWLDGYRPAFLVDSNGKVSTIQTATGSVTYTHPNTQGEFTVPFQPGSDGVSGIQQSGKTTFIFDNARQQWEPVNAKGLSLSIKMADGAMKSLSLGDLTQPAFRAIGVF